MALTCSLVQANEILQQNSMYLSTASVAPIHQHGGAWPGHPFGGREDGSRYRQCRSATCSPTRRGRSMSHVSADDYHEVMAQAKKYRQKAYYGHGGVPIPPGGSMGPGLTTSQHRPSYSGPSRSFYSASPAPTAAPGFLGYTADQNVTSADANEAVYTNQIKKLHRDVQQHANDLQRERLEGDKLRQDLKERDAAVQDARSVARTAKQQLVCTASAQLAVLASLMEFLQLCCMKVDSHSDT